MNNKEKENFKVGDKVKCVRTGALPGNSVSPPLKMDESYEVKDIWNDSEGNQHLDVGLKSNYSYIRSFETKEEIPNGDKIHWCHPSRFVIES